MICRCALFAALSAALSVAGPASAAIPPKKVAPSFACTKAKARSIEAIICASRKLSILDRTMGQRYRFAVNETPSGRKADLRAEQREWLASRNKCMTRKADRNDCIAFAYESRIERLEEWIDGSAWVQTE